MTMAPGRGSNNTGAIVYAVVATIAAVISIVLAIMFYVDRSKLEADKAGLERSYAGIVARADLSGATVSRLQAVADDDALGGSGQPLLNVASRSTDLLAEAITGNPQASFSSALDDLQNATVGVNAAVSEAAADGDAPAIPESGSAVNVINALGQELVAAMQAKQASDQALADAQSELEAVIQRTQAQLETSQQAVDAATQEKLDAIAQAAARGEDVATIAEALQGDFQTLQSSYNDSLENRDAQIRQLESARERLQAQLDQLRGTIASQLPSPERAIASVVDGNVTTVADNGNVYINLGTGAGIGRGMTFEVFDPSAGIPEIGSDDEGDSLPLGKASIEVIRVSPGSSEARVVATRGGGVAPGDLLLNVVYDRNIPFDFFVYGDFDLDNDGRSTPRDGEVVKQLVSQFGGRIIGEVNINTDFVVLGAEPTIPANLDPDDPLENVILEEARAAQEEYQRIKQLAVDLNIPVLDQNRFLAFTGQLDLARR